MSKTEFAVEGKVALVTGANRGIGKAIVISLVEAGAAKVYAGVRTLEKAGELQQELGDKVVAVALDLTEPETITRAAQQARDVELVINNAGILRAAGPLSETAISSLNEEMNVNVYGLLRMAQAFAPVLKSNGGGAFVQLNSVASLKCFPDFATYCASKAASYSITQALRAVLKEQGTQVLSVHPGPIQSDMANDAGLAEIAEPPTVVAEGIIKNLKAGEFHLFPDFMAAQFWSAYENFARAVVEAEEPGEG